MLAMRPQTSPVEGMSSEGESQQIVVLWTHANAPDA